MGRGRKKTPLATKKREGRRIRDETEIEPIPASLDCPDWLRPIGKELWFTLGSELVRLGMVSLLDEGGLAMLCNEWAIYREAEIELRAAGDDGQIFKYDNGYPQKHPLVSIRDKAYANYTKLAVEFGFTPTSRSKVSVVSTGKKEEDELDEFLGDDAVAGKIG